MFAAVLSVCPIESPVAPSCLRSSAQQKGPAPQLRGRRREAGTPSGSAEEQPSDKNNTNNTKAQTEPRRELTELASVGQRRQINNDSSASCARETCTSSLTRAIGGCRSAAAARLIGCVKQHGRNFGGGLGWRRGGAVGGLDGSLAAALHRPVRRSVHPSALSAGAAR